eukprot:574077-Pelagomonas_calceolata.AAC.9
MFGSLHALATKPGGAVCFLSVIGRTSVYTRSTDWTHGQTPPEQSRSMPVNSLVVVQHTHPTATVSLEVSKGGAPDPCDAVDCCIPLEGVPRLFLRPWRELHGKDAMCETNAGPKRRCLQSQVASKAGG